MAVSAVTATHSTTIKNRRPGSLYRVEVCMEAVNQLVGFGISGTQKRNVVTRSIISSASTGTFKAALAHLGTMGTDEIRTTVEFYDSAQRFGPSFSGPKESYDLAYEMDVV